MISLWLVGTAALAASRNEVCLQPIGAMPPSDLALARSILQESFSVTVLVLPARNFRADAPARRGSQIVAQEVLKDLSAIMPSRSVKIIGITNHDLVGDSGPSSLNLYGMGQIGGASCLVSTFRLRSDKPTESVYRTRLSNVLRHEFGHSLGLNHCAESRCLMRGQGAELVQISKRELKFCGSCHRKLS